MSWFAFFPDFYEYPCNRYVATQLGTPAIKLIPAASQPDHSL